MRMTQAYSEKENPSRVLLSGVEPNSFRLLVRMLQLPLSYRRLVGAKAIKLGSWDKHLAHLHTLHSLL